MNRMEELLDDLSWTLFELQEMPLDPAETRRNIWHLMRWIVFLPSTLIALGWLLWWAVALIRAIFILY